MSLLDELKLEVVPLPAAGETGRREIGSTAPRISLQPNDVKKGLGKLVLTLVELIRQLLERQAIRRMEAGSLSLAEVERLGLTFQQLADQMETLKGVFGLEKEDLNIDLGPLGKLL